MQLLSKEEIVKLMEDIESFVSETYTHPSILMNTSILYAKLIESMHLLKSCSSVMSLTTTTQATTKPIQTEWVAGMS
jgi:hypothetical protein